MADTKIKIQPKKPAYAFPVELQPIYLADGKQVAKRKAVVRTDTMQSLGLVSDDYTLVPHSSVVDSLREAGKKYDIEEKFALTHDGANMFYQMQFPRVQVEIGKGDLVQMTLTAKNSYNGMNSLQIIFGALRLVCLNGMVVGTEFLQFTYKHVGTMGGFIDGELVEKYQVAYSNYIKLFGEKAPMISQMAKTNVNAEGLFAKEAVNLPTYLLDEAKTSYETEKDKSLWGYYNSLTYAITHKAKTKNPGSQIWMGGTAWNKAEQLLNGNDLIIAAN